MTEPVTVGNGEPDACPSAICVHCGCCQIYFSVKIEQALMMLRGRSLVAFVLVRSRVTKKLLELRAGRQAAAGFPSISRSSSVPSASEAFNSYLNEIH